MDPDGRAAYSITLGNFGKFNSVIDLSKFAKVGKVAGNIGTGLTLYSLGSEFFGRESLTIDNVISKTVGSYIKGKSHEAVSKSYNYAKTQILKMISTGKLSYVNAGEKFPKQGEEIFNRH